MSNNALEKGDNKMSQYLKKFKFQRFICNMSYNNLSVAEYVNEQTGQIRLVVENKTNDNSRKYRFRIFDTLEEYEDFKERHGCYDNSVNELGYLSNIIQDLTRDIYEEDQAVL